jgi:hypothetical protein
VSAAALAVVVIAFPLISFAVLWRRQARLSHTHHLLSSALNAGTGGSEAGGSATATVVNPLRQLTQVALTAAATDTQKNVIPVEVTLAPPPLLAPFLSDYRPGAWYTRHADLALLLLLAALQVRSANIRGGGVNR